MKTSLASSAPVAGPQAVNAGQEDAFVARLSATLTTCLRTTFLGGTLSDLAGAVAIHPTTGDIYVVGTTSSVDFPGTSGGAQVSNTSDAGYTDAFVVRFNSALTQRLQSSYVGGSKGDKALAVAIHPLSGEIYVAGTSTSTNLPAAAGGAQPVASVASSDGFITRINAALTLFQQTTYVVGTAYENLTGLSIHPLSGEVYATGHTYSIDLTGTSGGVQSAFNGSPLYHDAFAIRFNRALTHTVQATYLGGTSLDIAKGIAIHPVSGDVYVAGETASNNFPGTGGGAQASRPATGGSSFVVRLSADLAANDQTPNPFAFVSQLGVPRSSVRTSNPASITGIVGAVPLYVEGAAGSSYCISSTNNCSCDISASFLSTLGTITNNSYVCVRHTSSTGLNVPTQTVLRVGTEQATFSVSTGTAFTGACTLDIDGSGGPPNAATDGLMLVRAMLGFTGTAVTNGAISGTPPRNTWPLIRDYLNQNCGANFAP